jgi:hypothetical protein
VAIILSSSVFFESGNADCCGWSYIVYPKNVLVNRPCEDGSEGTPCMETATFSAAIAMGAAEKKIDEQDLQFFMMVMMANLRRYWTFFSGWTKTEMVK